MCFFLYKMMPFILLNGWFMDLEFGVWIYEKIFFYGRQFCLYFCYIYFLVSLDLQCLLSEEKIMTWSYIYLL
jgi:hypothetical protein